jgi:hypothetical protein
MRRYFGPAAAGLCAAQGIFGRDDNPQGDGRTLMKHDRPDTVSQEFIVFREECD